MQRRQLLTALAAATVAPALAHARDQVTRVPLSNAFLLLSDYLKLAPDKRNLFHFSYLVRRKGKPAPDTKAAYLLPDGTRTPVAFGADGEVTNLPTLAQLSSKAKFETDGPAVEFGLELRLSAKPTADLEVAALESALAQANAAVSVFSEGQGGRLTDAYFPDATTGQVVFANGRTTALRIFDFPNLGRIPYIDLRHVSGAQTVKLDHAPSRVLLGGPPHRS